MRDPRLTVLIGLLCALVACTGAVPEVPPPPPDDLGLLIGDIEHLLDRALAEQRVGDRSAASATATDAYARFRNDVAPILEAHDRTLLLRTEYAFGRFRDRVGSRGEGPTDRLKELRSALATARRAGTRGATP